METVLRINRDYKDFRPAIIGRDNCEPGHKFGPYVRFDYLIHFVLEGKGTFINETNTYHLSKGQAFLIRPGELCTYMADEKDPWHYAWVHFDGALAKEFDKFPDVFDIDKSFVKDFLLSFDMDENIEEYVTGMLFVLFSKLLSPNSKKDFQSKIKQYIDINYMDDITVEGMANLFNMNRKYLSKIFKQQYNITIQQYLLEKRLTEAQKFLDLGYSVKQSAAMSGYKDPFNFSKSFKAYYGVSPLEYKKLKSKQ